MPQASRLLLASMVAAGLAVTYAAFVLFVFPDRSEDLFTWDIQLPVTAAFLGAMYATGTPLLFLVGRPRTSWLQVRAVLPPFVTVSLGMLVATLLHTDRFIWSSAVT
jgi:cytochrome bd-type quinol oxidase subunit 1